MSTLLKRNGSGLLLTVLTLAAFSVVSGLLIQIFLTSGRANGTLSAAKSASQMAEQGIQEGLLRYRANANGSSETLNLCKEYGDGAATDTGSKPTTCSSPPMGSYSLLPLRRGYLSGCSTPTADMPIALFTGDLSCPYYDLAVRNQVVLATGQTYNFPVGMYNATYGVNTESGLAGGLFTLSNISSSGSGRISCISDCSIKGANEYLVPSPGPNVVVQFSNGSSNLKFQIITSVGGNKKIQFSIMNNDPDKSIIVQKGVTSIESTGYSGGIHQQKLLNIYDGSSNSVPWPSTSKVERLTSQTYGSTGCFTYANPPPSTCSAL